MIPLQLPSRSGFVLALAAFLAGASGVGADTDRWQPYPPGVGGPWGGSVRRLVSPGDPGNLADPLWDELWAATGGGVFYSADGGANWQSRNQGLEDLDVTDIDICRSAPANLVVATADRGVHLSTDGGANWNRVGTSLHVWRVAIDPADSNHLFVARFEDSDDVLESFDGGGVWNVLDTRPVTRFVFAADGALYYSTRTGRIFRYGAFDPAPLLIHRLPGTVEIVELVLPGNDGSTIAAAQGGDGLWVGADGGDGWEAFGDDTANDSWEEMTGLWVSNPEFLEVDAVTGDPLDPTGQRLVYHLNDPFAGAATALFESPDLGSTSTLLDLPEAGLEVTQLFATPAAEWLAEEKAGMFRRDGRSGGFAHASRGLAAYVATDLAFSPDRMGGLAVAGGGPGLGNGGMYRWDPAGAGWQRVAPAPGDPIVEPPDPLDPGPVRGAFPPTSTELVRYRGSEIWLGVKGRGLYRSLDSGSSWEYRGEGLGNTARQTIFSLVFAPAAPQAMVAGTLAGVYFSTDAGAQWSRGAGLPATVGWVVAYDVRSSLGFFAGGRTANNGVFAHSDNGGAVWTELAPGWFSTSNRQIISLSASLDVDGHLLAGTRASGLFESFDGGLNWAYPAGGFPAAGGVAAVALAEGSGDRWGAAAVDNQVYVTSDGGSSWRGVTSGLPVPGGTPTAINALTFFSGSPRLVAALHGRGLWYLDVETVAPVAAVSGVPTSPTKQTGAFLSVGGMDVVNYRYSLDGGLFSAARSVTSGIVVGGLAEGWHTVRVVGINAAGTQQPVGSATTVSWTVDTTPPVATLTGAPEGTTNQSTATLQVAGDAVVNYRYNLDAGPYSTMAPVTTLITLTGLSNGLHTLGVVGIDAAGNEQPTSSATTASWTVDVTLPVATISGAPEAVTVHAGATLKIGGAAVVSYRYSLDGGSFSTVTPVATPITLIGLLDGEHTVRVLGIDDLGNEQLVGSATTASWTVDTTPPVATVAGAPEGVTDQTGAILRIGGADVVSYRYRLDGGMLSIVTPVATPITLTGLADGEHTVRVVGIDAVGNEQPVGSATPASWTVDIMAELVATVSGAPEGVTSQTGATLTVGGTGVVSYRYSLDGGTFSAVTPVATPITLAGLADGEHTVRVVGIDAAGNQQPVGSATPASWTVNTTLTPVATVFDAPEGITNQPGATLMVGGTEVVNYRYSLDGGAFSAVTPVATPITLTGLADGEHTVRVVGVDAAGNQQPEGSATSASWTVDTTSPVAVVFGAPEGVTGQTGATLTVGGRGVVNYRYRLDDGPFSTVTPVAIRIVLTNLGEGSHVVQVLASDVAGNEQPESSPTVVEWTVEVSAAATSGGSAGGCFLSALGG